MNDEQRSKVHPLIDAFNYWNKGLYNTGDPKHTGDVKSRGEKVMSKKVIQKWIENSEYAQKALKNKKAQ